MTAEFTKALPGSCLHGSGLVLPSSFRESVIKDSGKYTLEDEQGRQFPCTVTIKQQGNHERADITGGWRAFVTAQNLQEHDEIKVSHAGGRTLKVVKTGRKGTPGRRTPRAKTPGRKPASGRASTAKKSASKTPGTAGGTAKRSGGTAGRRRRSAAASAAAADAAPATDAAAPEPAGAGPMDEVPAGPLPEYVPPAGEYMAPIWPKWCTIM